MIWALQNSRENRVECLQVRTPKNLESNSPSLQRDSPHSVPRASIREPKETTPPSSSRSRRLPRIQGRNHRRLPNLPKRPPIFSQLERLPKRGANMGESRRTQEGAKEGRRLPPKEPLHPPTHYREAPVYHY